MGFSFQIEKTLGEFKLDLEAESQGNRLGILGASGCGKSLTLKLLAGIESPDAGRIQIGAKLLFDSRQNRNVKPQDRRIGYLFQNYALFPHMTVAENIGAGLQRVDKSADTADMPAENIITRFQGKKIRKQKRIQEMMEKFQLTGLAARLPGELSGGQQQRVALARIMACEPEVILLDEPFSALDVFLKDQMQRELEELLEGFPGLVVLVSHSRDEIYRFSEELLVMDQGHAVVYGATKEIFANPRYREAARLTGCKNIADARRLDAHRLEVPDWGIRLCLKREIPEDITAVGYRAHDFVPVWSERKENCLEVRIKRMAEMPFEYHYYLQPAGPSEQKSKEERPVSSSESKSNGERPVSPSEQKSKEERPVSSSEQKSNGERPVSSSEPASVQEQSLCWFVQKGKHIQIAEKGFPAYLELKEEHIMLF